MHSLSSLLRSKVGLAIGLYVIAFASLFVLAGAQKNAMQLFQADRAANLQ